MSTPSPLPNPLMASSFAVPAAGRDHRPGDPRTDAGTMYVASERILAKTQATHLKLKPRIALVVRAMVAAGHRIEGLSDDLLATPLSPKSAQVVDQLRSAFAADQVLAHQIETALVRFLRTADTLRSVEDAIEGMVLQESLVQELKLAAFYLSRFHEAVKDEPLMAQLFPEPRVLQADAGQAEVRQLAGSSQLGERARRMLADLQPAVTAVRFALGVLAPSHDAGAAPTGFVPRAAVLAAMHIERLWPLAGFIEETVRAYDRLAEAVERNDPAEPWARLMGGLGQSMDDLNRNPVLREIIRSGS